MSERRTADAATIAGPAIAARAAARDERLMSIGEWADEHLMIPRGTGAIRHRSDLVPYWRRWHRGVQDRILGTGTFADVEHLTIVAATQVAKTFGFIVPSLAWMTALHPADVGVILPGDTTRRRWMNDKLQPAFEKSPRLAGLLPSRGTDRDKRLGPKAWKLDNCTIYGKNGAVALELRMDDLPRLISDEFGALPMNVDGQGSPLVLAGDRQKTFPLERIHAKISTPDDVNGLAWSQLCVGTHERLYVACLKCPGNYWLDDLLLESTRQNASIDDFALLDCAVHRCPHCGRKHTSDERDTQVRAACVADDAGPAGGWILGEWKMKPDGTDTWTPAAIFHDNGRLKSAAKPVGIHHSGWLNALYSPFITCGRYMAASREADEGSIEIRQAFCNGWRALPWQPLSDSVRHEHLALIEVADLAGYQLGRSPAPAAHLVLTLDQQGVEYEHSWFPWVLRAWSDTGESWLVDCGKAMNWAEAELLCARTWRIGTEDRKADAIAMDTANGMMIRHIREWCRKEPARRLSLAGSGTMDPATPWSEIRLNQKNQKHLHGLPVVYYFNAHYFRDELYERIRGAAHVPPWHRPADAPDWYLDSLTSEERSQQTALIRGRRITRSVWAPRQFRDQRGVLHVRKDNHWWDAEVINLALVSIKGWTRARQRTLTTTQFATTDHGFMDGYT